MNVHHASSPTGRAAAGMFVAPHGVGVFPDIDLSATTASPPQSLILESYDGLMTREERKFLDWGVGILEDAGVVGVLRNDSVYQAATLRGEIHTGAGSPYFFSISKSLVEFADGGRSDQPIRFEGGMVEAEGEGLEAHEVGHAFASIRRQSALTRAWEDATMLASTNSVILEDLRILFAQSEIAMDVETDLAEFTVNIRRSPKSGAFQYSLTNAETPIVHSLRVADALLCDAAEEAGGVPDPSTILCAMVSAAETVRSDPEWLASAASQRNSRT